MDTQGREDARANAILVNATMAVNVIFACEA